jgi:hypothetical protein
MALEDRTARLTILIDPRKKALFDRLCAEEDATPSQVVRRLIRTYIEQRTGQPWNPTEEPRKATEGRKPMERSRPRRTSAKP